LVEVESTSSFKHHMSETVGRYEILEKIGQGGMGAVYKAFDPVLRRTVAVKVISAVLDSKPEIRERFFREAQSAGQLSHKNIIVIYDLGEDCGRPFLAMEYLTGAALSTRMTGGRRLSVRRAVDVMIQVCHALEYAHERGVVHRDVTPANIFVTDLDEVKILDFGLAHLVASELTRSETIMGTVNYMSPEQVRGERVDRRTDIFAAGVVLYELLSGRKAFEGDSFANTLFKVLESSPPSLQALDPQLPPRLVAVVDRALAKRREERYQTAGEMLRELITCRDWTDSAPALPPTLAPTVVGAGVAAAVSSVDALPTSAPWSPRRVRTTAIVGGVLAIAGALLIFDSWQNESSNVASREQTAAAVTQPAPAPTPAPPPATLAPPATSAPAEKPPVASIEPVKPSTLPVMRSPDASGTTQADRTRANEAIARARKIRTLAESAGAEGLTAYRRAIATEGEAAGLYAAGQFARAAARALEAEAMYRDAEIEARADQTARDRLRAESAPPPAVPVEMRPVEPPRAEPPRAEPTPSVQAEPAREAEDSRESIRTVLNQYVAALEARSIGALKAIWPSLPPTQERAIRSDFANVRSLKARLADLRIEVDGATAIVTAMREYQLVTEDGHRPTANTRITMRMRRAGEGWVIDGITYE
jgi:serine/threonine-protein kinase